LLKGVTTLASSGTVSFRFSSAGAYITTLYSCVLTCVRMGP
jgi:hypothetical protein